IWGATAAVTFFLGIGSWLAKGGWIFKRMEILGQYSLVAYIVQIGVLQVLVRFLHRPDPMSLTFLALFGGTLFFTVMSAEILHWMRPRLSWADGAYKTVFA